MAHAQAWFVVIRDLAWIWFFSMPLALAYMGGSIAVIKEEKEKILHLKEEKEKILHPPFELLLLLAAIWFLGAIAVACHLTMKGTW